jgi:hypothetical protein
LPYGQHVVIGPHCRDAEGYFFHPTTSFGNVEITDDNIIAQSRYSANSAT